MVVLIMNSSVAVGTGELMGRYFVLYVVRFPLTIRNREANSLKIA